MWLERALAVPPAGAWRASSRWWLWAGALPAAAAFAVAITLVMRHDAPPAAVPLSPLAADAAGPSPVVLPATFKPIAAENVLYAAQDEGIVTLEDGSPARRERLNFVDTITWKDSRTNASVRWTIPREEVRVIPVSFH